MNNFNSEAYRNMLLLNIPQSKLASGGREITCRCFYCSDSKDKSHGHFYISIPQNDEPSSFYCQKCHASGIVTHNILMEWGIYDLEISTQLAKYNSKILKISKNKKYINDIIYNISNTYISENDMSYKKLNYINNRLGLYFTFDDCRANKICLNLYDLLNENNIQQLSRNKNIVDLLNNYFLGFISFDNSFLNMRNLYKGELPDAINKRYINYNIFNKYDNTKRFYILPSSINLCVPEPIQLHLAEGPFDILSIKYNLRKNDNAIYAAINGSGYENMCKFLITTMKLINLEIHIYPDKDIDDNKINYIARKLAVFENPLYIHRNIMDGEKDFGVRPERIKEFIIRLY